MRPLASLILLAVAASVTAQNSTSGASSSIASNSNQNGSSSNQPMAPAGPVATGLASLLGASAMMPAAAVAAGPETMAPPSTMQPTISSSEGTKMPENGGQEMGGRRGMRPAVSMTPEIVPDQMATNKAAVAQGEPVKMPIPLPEMAQARPVMESMLAKGMEKVGGDQMPPMMNPEMAGPLMRALPMPMVDPQMSQMKPVGDIMPMLPPRPPMMPQIMPEMSSPPAPMAIDLRSVESLPDDAKILKTIIAQRDELIKNLVAEKMELKNNCDRPGPIGIMAPMPVCDCAMPAPDEACANLIRMKDDDIDALKQRLASTENKYGEVVDEMKAKELRGKSAKKSGSKNKKIEIIVQKKKNTQKKLKANDKFKQAPVSNPCTGCQSLLENEKSITNALLSGVKERDAQITNLQEMLKSAEDKVSIVQNAEINSCTIKMQNADTELNNCKEEVRQNKMSSNLEKKGDDDDEGDDDDDDDEDDAEIMSIVKRIMSTGSKGKVAVINYNKNALKIKKRIENKMPVITLGDKEYYFHNISKVSWKQANAMCEKRKMRLLSIEHDEENAMVSAEVMNTATVYWTSGKDSTGQGDFEWTAVKKSFNNFLNWAPGQPEIGNPKKNCVDVGPYGDGAMWKVSDCSLPSNYICKRTVQEG